MKNILLILLFCPVVGLAQWPTSSTSDTTTFRTSSDNMYLKNADSTTLKNSLLKNADSTTFRATSDASYLKNADSTTVKNTIRQEIADSIDANAIKTNAILGKKAFWGATDSLGSVTEQIELELDSTLQLAGHQVRIAGPLPSAITIDSIHTVGGPSTINLTAAYYYNDSLWTDASATAIITSPAATTDEYIGAWQSTLNNATVPINNFIWLTFTAVTTASNKFIVVIRYHYGSS